MSRIRVHSLAVSLDGFAAGRAQSLDAPMGVGGEALHGWVFETAYGRAMIGAEGGTVGIDHSWLVRGDVGIGATVMGRNMFGPVRGDWVDSAWTGWWGAEPPYHHPVFVLTHHPRPSLTMTGGTTFHFVTDGLAAAVGLAREAAGAGDVRIGGGASVVRDALRAGVVDDIHLAVVPVLLKSGEQLYSDLGMWPEGYRCVETAAGESVVHLRFARTA